MSNAFDIVLRFPDIRHRGEYNTSMIRPFINHV